MSLNKCKAIPQAGCGTLRSAIGATNRRATPRDEMNYKMSIIQCIALLFLVIPLLAGFSSLFIAGEIHPLRGLLMIFLGLVLFVLGENLY